MAFATESNIDFEIINYLENPLSVDELKNLLQKLNIKPMELVRQNEKLWIENYKGKSLSDNEIIATLAKHPILIERPIVIDGNKAIIGREIEKLETFLK